MTASNPATIATRRAFPSTPDTFRTKTLCCIGVMLRFFFWISYIIAGAAKSPDLCLGLFLLPFKLHPYTSPCTALAATDHLLTHRIESVFSSFG